MPKPSTFKNRVVWWGGRGGQWTYPNAGGQSWIRPSSQYVNGIWDGKTRQACMD